MIHLLRPRYVVPVHGEYRHLVLNARGGDVGTVVLRDRQHLARDGVLIALVALDRHTGRLLQEPEVLSRGFVYQKGAEELLEAIRGRVRQAVERGRRQGQTESGAVRTEIRDQVSRFVYQRTGRQPMVLPLLVEV